MITSFKNEYLNDVCNLGLKLNSKFNTLYNEESLNSDVNKTYLYILDEKVVAFLHIQELIDEIDIINIIVAEEFRRKKIATKLIEYIVNNYPNEKIILEVNSSNKAAINLYKNLGFKEINRRKHYYKDADAIIMEKK